MTPPSLHDRPSQQIEIDGRAVVVKVRESSQAKTARILIGARRPPEIIVPAGTRDQEVRRLLAARSAWLAQKLALVDAEQQRPAQLGLDRGGVVWLAGCPIEITQQQGARARADLRDDRLVVIGEDAAARGLAMERWYRRQAGERIRYEAGIHAERLGLQYRCVAVRDQQTRWGSCSRAGNLSFNWRLIMAPTDVMAYVVVHELCHLVVPNHSKPFWRQLEAALPNWQTSASWLTRHGAELRSYTTTA